MELQKTVQNLLNAGIGLYKVSEENLKRAITEFDKVYEELVQKGQQENSEMITNLRKNIDDIVKQIEDLNTKASQTLEDVSKQIQDNYQKLIAEIEKNLPKEQIDQIRSKVEEFIGNIQNQIQEVTKQFKKEEPKE